MMRVRESGLAAMAGGVLWTVTTVIHAMKPVGCVGGDCATRAMRRSGTAEGVLTLLAFVLFAVGAAGVLTLARRAGRLGALGRLSAILAAAGVLTLICAGLVQALLFSGDFPLMPYFVIPGVLALAIGVLLLGIAVLRARVLPAPVAAGMLVAAVAMLGFNEQTHLAWLALPFGFAWIAVGWVLWSGQAGRRGGDVVGSLSAD